jgi:hypothetical protein
MSREDIIRMAATSNLSLYGMGKDKEKFYKCLENFALLIAEQEFKKGFYAGWNKSAEGFNSEYGTTDNRVYEMCNEAWKEIKNEL